MKIIRHKPGYTSYDAFQRKLLRDLGRRLGWKPRKTNRIRKMAMTESPFSSARIALDTAWRARDLRTGQDFANAIYAMWLAKTIVKGGFR